MAILLLKQLRQITEGVHYVPPSINVFNKGKEDPATRKKATQMFYDLYAMELMHSMIGNPSPDPETGSSFDNSPDTGRLHPAVLWSLKFGIMPVPFAMRKVVDQVYEEVVIALTEKMMTHLRLTLVQEFRHIIAHASDWQHFRQSLVSLYNKQTSVSKQDFENLIANHIPGLKEHTDTVVRLLKFCKYYASMHPDPADKLSPDIKSPKVEPPKKTDLEPAPEDQPYLPDLPDVPAKPMPMPGEPDATDYDAPEIPQAKPGADWDEDDPSLDPEIEKAKLKQWHDTHKGGMYGIDEGSYEAGRISPHTVLAVRNAINQSGLTWNDILLAYKHLDWGGAHPAYGGPDWGPVWKHSLT